MLPIHEEFGNFSLAWGGHYIGESVLDLLEVILESGDLHEVK